MKSLRADVVIATLALLISAGATLSSLYQTRVIANQLSSSVWPYLAIEASLSRTSFRLDVTNDGLGPALLRSAELYYGGRRYGRLRDWRSALVREAKGRGPFGKASADFESIGANSVVRAGDHVTVMQVSGPFVARLGDLSGRLSLRVCYCSLLDQCWTVEGPQAPRVATASCPNRETLDF